MNNTPAFEYIDGAAFEALQGDCQDVIDFALSQYDVTLRFDDQSVQWLSSFIEEIRSDLDENTLRVMSIKFATFLGNAIISHHGGRWIMMKDGNIAVLFSTGSIVYPFTKTCKQFENGLVDNIYGLYRNIETLLQGEDSKKDSP